MASDLEAARITSLPEDAFYIPDFITEDEENYLLHKVSWTLHSHSTHALRSVQYI